MPHAYDRDLKGARWPQKKGQVAGLWIPEVVVALGSVGEKMELGFFGRVVGGSARTGKGEKNEE